MKTLKFHKVLSVLAFMAIGFVSCDKAADEEQSLLLVKETMESNLYGDETYSYEYNEQNQLMKVIVHSETEDYIDDIELSVAYENNALSELFMSTEGMQQKVTFSYAEDSIISMFSVKEGDEDWYEGEMRSVSILNSQQQIIRDEEYVNLSGKWTLHSYSDYGWTNGNYVEHVHVYNVNSKKKSAKLRSYFMPRMNASALLKSGSNETTIMTEVAYNSFKNPYQSLGLKYAADANNNNVVRSKKVRSSNSAENVFSYTYEVNDKNYPTKMIEIDSKENTMTTIYEYKSIN